MAASCIKFFATFSFSIRFVSFDYVQFVDLFFFMLELHEMGFSFSFVFPEKVYFFSFWVVVNCFWVEVVHLKYFFWLTSLFVLWCNLIICLSEERNF